MEITECGIQPVAYKYGTHRLPAVEGIRQFPQLHRFGVSRLQCMTYDGHQQATMKKMSVDGRRQEQLHPPLECFLRNLGAKTRWKLLGSPYARLRVGEVIGDSRGELLQPVGDSCFV